MRYKELAIIIKTSGVVQKFKRGRSKFEVDIFNYYSIEWV